MLHSFGHCVQHCWTRACPLSWPCGYLLPWQWFTVYTCFVRSAWMLRYGMANEESFQSLSEESTSDLFANRKIKGKAAVENPRTVKSPLSKYETGNSGIDKFLLSRGIVEFNQSSVKTVNLLAAAIINSLTILLKYCFSPLRFIQCLVFPLFVTLSLSSSNISSTARAAKHIFTVDRSRVIF